MELIRFNKSVVLHFGKMREDGEEIWVCRVAGTRAVSTGKNPIEAARGALKAAQQWSARGKLDFKLEDEN